MQTIGALKEALIKKGLPTSGRKADLVTRLSHGFNLGFSVERIVSLDLGVKNCAVAVVDAQSGDIEEWQLLSLIDSQKETAKNVLTVREVSRATKNFHSHHLQPIINQKPTTTLTVMERQRYRSGGATAVLEAALMNVLMESVLSVLIDERFLLSVEPKAVARYYDLPSGYTEKKRAAVKLVSDRILRADDKHAHLLKSTKKKDDLADALLQAWAVRDWINMR